MVSSMNKTYLITATTASVEVLKFITVKAIKEKIKRGTIRKNLFLKNFNTKLFLLSLLG
jgi:hypothetical protein